jgi:hypothetical protein
MVDSKIVEEPLPDFQPMGEADVKFPRWANKFERMLVDSIDGDSVPIALINHERLLTQDICPPKVSIYRMKIQPTYSKLSVKRMRIDDKYMREYEYLDINMLYTGLMQCIKQATGILKFPKHTGHEMRMLVTLITLTGTDFTRHLPQVALLYLLYLLYLLS